MMQFDKDGGDEDQIDDDDLLQEELDQAEHDHEADLLADDQMI